MIGTMSFQCQFLLWSVLVATLLVECFFWSCFLVLLALCLYLCVVVPLVILLDSGSPGCGSPLPPVEG